MKKRFGILLSVIVLLLVMTVAVACDPKKGNEPETQKYEISFVTNGGSEVKSIVAEAGSDISALLPADPQKSGVYFGGWSLENNGFASTVSELPTEMPEANVTYYARWTWHATVVPKLQPLGENGEPDKNADNYVASGANSLTVEVDPQNPELDMSKEGNSPAVKGYKLSGGQQFNVTLDSNDATVSLKYDLVRYNISFNLNNTAVSGKINGVSLYLGQKFELPDLPEEITINMPTNLRFAGWSSDYDGEKDFGAVDSEVVIGEEGSLVDGSETRITLFAVYDEAYIDFSRGQDYVFVPKHEQGVAYVRRGGIDLLKGDFVPNPDVSETTPHLGLFNIVNEAGTTLRGYVYEDGHFAYEQTSIDPNLPGMAIINYSQEENSLVEGNILTLIDCYGCATLELASPITIGFGVDAYTLEAGKHVGGYWYDSSFEDYCFTVIDKIEGEEYLFDFHFQFVRMSADSEELYFAFEGKEMGIYCDSILPDNTLAGDMLVLDGYGAAVAIIGNSQYTGQYFRVGENSDGDATFLVSLYNSAGEYHTMLFSANMAGTLGYSNSNLPIRQYGQKGDGSLFVQCANEDGSTFYSDGFGNGAYKQSDGTEISGTAEIVGELFESTTPAVVYKLTESGGEAHYFVMDYFMTANNSIDAHFTHFTSESEVNVKYLYNTSEKAGEYVGAIVTAGNKAYYLTAVTTSAGNVIFSDINEGTVSEDGGYLFKSDEYIISYEDDDARSTRYDTPTVTTEQMKLAELTFSVVGDDGNELGTLTITQDGKATYKAGGFEAAEYEFAYSSVIVKQGQDVSMFVVDEFGKAPKAIATVKKDLLVAAIEEPQGELYVFKQGGKESAMLWMLMYGEMHFYAVAEISEAPKTATQPMNGKKVYLIDTLLSSYYAIKNENDDYLAPNNLLRNGEFVISDGTTSGTDKLQLDSYGFAKYTQGDTTYDGSYGVVEGVYSAKFNGTPANFKFVLAGANFQKVDYSEFYVVNPATLGVNSVLRVHGGTIEDIAEKSAELFRASEDSDGNVSVGSKPLATGKITSGSEGIYTFSGKSNAELESDDMAFTFRFDEYIFTQTVFVRNNVTLPKGEFKEDASEAQTKKVTLDEYGRATYFDGSEERVGFYFVDGSMYRFVDDADREFDLQFTLNEAEERLIIFGAKAKPFAGGEFEFTYKNETHTLNITVLSDGTMKATLKKGGEEVAKDKELAVDADGIYTFDPDGEKLKFIISKGAIVTYDPKLDYQQDIWVGNMWLLKEHNLQRLEYVTAASGAVTLIVKGFKEVAEINNYAEIIKGSISTSTKDDYELVTFTDEYGNTQNLYNITYQSTNGTATALFVEGSEKGLAIEYYYTMGVSGRAVAYFDGLGRAYKLDENDKPTDEVIGYYYFYDTYYIAVGNFKEGDEKTFIINDIYTPYGLRLTQLDGTSENVTGVVAYNDKYDTIAIADDGSVFIFDGFDGVTYVDSQGVMHTGYFNNYGEMTTGTPDNRYLITDEYDNATLFFIDFDEGGSQEGFATARRASYVVYTPYTNLYSEVQFMSADDYEKPEGENNLPDEVPEGKQGFAILVIMIDGEQGAYWGFYTIEGGLMIIEVYGRDGEYIELNLYVDGTADWNNYSEWLSSELE